MLRQILQDMYIEPELLAELDEEQKQILFCKMREEQVKRWKNREEQNKEERLQKKDKEGGKKVSFLMGGDGEPVVVVLGREEDVDALLQERAKRQAEMEGETLRRVAEEELDKLVRLSQSTVKAMEQNSHNRSHPPQTPKVPDPTRDAVVRSLQEATQEMEEEMRALELQEKEGVPSSDSKRTPLSLGGNLKPVKDSLNSSKQLLQTSVSGTTTPAPWDSSNWHGSSSRPQISVSPYASDKQDLIPFGVAAQIEQFEKLSESSLEALKTATLERAKNRRQKEILDNLRHQVEEAKNQASAAVTLTAEKEEVAWREQERKAKEAEKRIREIARRAREEHRRTTSSSSSSTSSSDKNSSLSHEELIDDVMCPSPDAVFIHGDINGNVKTAQDDFSNNNKNMNCNGNLNVGRGRNNLKNLQQLRPIARPRFRPPSKEAVMEWFKEEELLKKGSALNRQRDVIEPWFHGIISRVDAERILEAGVVGSFLVRVSERIWGYAVSYKAPDRCRHYLVDAIGGGYAFLGAHQNSHVSLGNLIEYHRKEYITASGKEILSNPVGQADPKHPDYLELFIGTPYYALAKPKN